MPCSATTRKTLNHARVGNGDGGGATSRRATCRAGLHAFLRCTRHAGYGFQRSEEGEMQWSELETLESVLDGLNRQTSLKTLESIRRVCILSFPEHFDCLIQETDLENLKVFRQSIHEEPWACFFKA